MSDVGLSSQSAVFCIMMMACNNLLRSIFNSQFSTFQVQIWPEISSPQGRPLPSLLSQAQVTESRSQKERFILLKLRQLQITPALRSTVYCILFTDKAEIKSRETNVLFCVKVRMYNTSSALYNLYVLLTKIKFEIKISFSSRDKIRD